jgi:hypothetical protein
MVEKTLSDGTLSSAPSLLHRWKSGVIFVCVMMLFGVVLYPMLGVWGILVSAGIGVYLGTQPMQGRWLGGGWRSPRLTLEGIALSRKRGRSKEALLAWGDIERIKLLRLWGFFPLPLMRVILRRRQSFWTMKRSQVRRYTFWWTTWRRRAFREALRRHLIAAHVDPHVWSLPIPKDHHRFRRVASVALIILGLVCGGLSFQLLWTFRLSSLWMGTHAVMVLTLLGIWLGVFGRPRLLRGGGGLVFLNLPTACSVALVWLGAWYILGWPVVLGICVGLALLPIAIGLFLVLMPRRPPGWTAAPVYLAVILGFFMGWWGSGGIWAVRLPCREFGFSETPWTPNGDAFLLTMPQSFPILDDEAYPVDMGVAWQHPDGTPIREVPLPYRGFSVVMVGQDTALVVASVEGNKRSLISVSKSGRIEELLTAGGIRAYRGMTSPNRRWLTLRASWGEIEEDYKTIWYRVDANQRRALPLSLPHPHEEVTDVAVDDTGALFWLKGKEAEPRVSSGFPRERPPPAPETFEEPGHPFSLWYDDPSDPAPPVELHAEGDVWLDYKVVDRMRCVYATRLVRYPELHCEHVCLRLDGQKVTVEPATKDYDIQPTVMWFRNGEWIGPPEKSRGSPDGRFLVELGEGGMPSFRRLWITDTRTGRRLCLRPSVNEWRESWFSPNGRWLLLGSFKAIRSPWVLNPMRGIKLSQDILVVDLEAAFPAP